MRNEHQANHVLHAYAVARVAKVGKSFAVPSKVVRPAKVSKVEKILKFFRITTKK